MKKFVGTVYAAMAMLSVGVMVVLGILTNSWDNLWLIPFGAMILATVFAVIVGAVDDNKSSKK